MERVQFEAEIRGHTKKEFCKKLRKNGKIPAVVYGLEKKPVSLAIDYAKFTKMRMKTKGESCFIDLSMKDDGGVFQKTVIIKDIQAHPVTGKALHADFLEINMAEKRVFDVHLIFKNEDIASKKGILDHQMRTVQVKALPQDTPDHIEVDLASLEAGKSVHVRDILKLVSDRVEIFDDPDKVIVSLIRHVVKEEKPTVATEAPAPEQKEE